MQTYSQPGREPRVKGYTLCMGSKGPKRYLYIILPILLHPYMCHPKVQCPHIFHLTDGTHGCSLSKFLCDSGSKNQNENCKCTKSLNSEYFHFTHHDHHEYTDGLKYGDNHSISYFYDERKVKKKIHLLITARSI